jgi:hypothetical protein
MTIVSQIERVGQMKIFNVRDDMAREIAFLAAKRKMSPEALVNEILEQYVIRQSLTQEQSGPAFLLSIAGMFDSGPNETSERVQAVVAASIIEKHRELMHEGIG